VHTDRDALVSVGDWLVQRHRDQVDAGMPAVLTAAQDSARLTYRQALHDITLQEGFPFDVDGPPCSNHSKRLCHYLVLVRRPRSA